jgi:hypothetical protein
MNDSLEDLVVTVVRHGRQLRGRQQPHFFADLVTFSQLDAVFSQPVVQQLDVSRVRPCLRQAFTLEPDENG